MKTMKLIDFINKVQKEEYSDLLTDFIFDRERYNLEKLQKENKELKQKVKLLNEMNKYNYNKYCEALKKIESLETKYWVRKVKSKNIIEDFGNMTLDEIKQFGKQFIGNKTINGYVFKDISDLYADIDFIKERDSENWYLGEHEDIVISKVI